MLTIIGIRVIMIGMIKKHKKYFLGGAAFLAILAVLAFTVAHKPLNSSSSQTAHQGRVTVSTACDTSLEQHVYHPARLHVINKCVSVTGTIDRSTKEADGDVHIRLKVDSKYSFMLNAKNNSIQHGDLVLEPVCEATPTQTDAVSACTNYHSSVTVPAVGTHVQVVGPYVLDADHGWNEIHPVTSITSQ